MSNILVTGCGGFIGSNLVDKLLTQKYKVIGIDNFNDYYERKIKEKNLELAKKNKNFRLYREDILNFDLIKKIFEGEKPTKVVHLAARTGVRPSIENPMLYTRINVEGTVNLLKLSSEFKVKQFIFGSSSSVYGNSTRIPFTENDPCDAIISPYGASKRSAEFWVESFYRSFGLKSIILRFFTVYGPRGRPDMAPALFTKAILNNKPINQFGDGTSSRDYTYIDDIIDGIVKTLNKNLDFEIINLGNNQPINLNNFIKTVERITGKGAKIKKLPVQSGDLERTCAAIEKAKKRLDWKPSIEIEEGLNRYTQWLENT